MASKRSSPTTTTEGDPARWAHYHYLRLVRRVGKANEMPMSRGEAQDRVDLSAYFF
jgi:hypothetical protein